MFDAEQNKYSDTPEDNFRFILKFGKKEHLELFLQGFIYCNTLEYFKNLEVNMQGDKLEGITGMQQGALTTIKIKEREFNTNISARMHFNDPKVTGNLFCLYGANEKELEEFYSKRKVNLIDANALSFGDYFLFINNPKELIRRISVALDNEGYTYEIRKVKYRNYNTYSGSLTIFDKSDKFRGQQEIRIWISNESKIPININIGSIADIAYGPYEFEKIFEMKIILANER